MRRLFLLFLPIALTGCLGAEIGAGTPSDPATETFASSLGVNIDSMIKTPDGDYYKDIVVGTGAQLTSPAVLITVTYNAFLKNGYLFSQDQDTQFALSSETIGLQDGMTAGGGMREGGERLIVIPSANGFGNALVTNVPQNSTQVWDIRLESIDQ